MTFIISTHKHDESRLKGLGDFFKNRIDGINNLDLNLMDNTARYLLFLKFVGESQLN